MSDIDPTNPHHGRDWSILGGILKKIIIWDISMQNPYLVRWDLELPFKWSLKLHKILRPDADRCAHDHPWWFWRLILHGGYREICGHDNRTQDILPYSFHYCPPGFRHRITELFNGGPSWSLVLTGPKINDWGFYTQRGWMIWHEFVNVARSVRVLWCDDGSELK